MNANHLTPSATCVAIAPLLPVLDEPETDPRAVAEARAHIQDCAYCQAQLGQYATLTSALQARFSETLSQRRTEEIMRTIAQRDQTIQNATHPQSTPSSRHPPFISGIVAVAAVVLLAVFAQLIFSNRQGGVGGNHTPVVSLPNTQGYFTDISMVSPTEGWATGYFTKTAMGSVPANTVVLYHYHNAAWSPVMVPVPFALNNGYFTGKISMDSPTDGWVVGSNDRADNYVLHYANGAWHPITSPAFGNSILRVQALSPTSVWVATLSPLLYHFDGVQWTSQDLSGALGLTRTTQLLGFQMISNDEGWAVVTGGIGKFFGSIFLHYSHGSWIRPVENDIIPNVGIGALTMTSATEGWALGSEIVPDATGNTSRVPFKQHIYHYQQGQWSEGKLPLSQLNNVVLDAIGIAAADDVWVTGQDNSTIYGQTTAGYHSNSVLLHLVGGQWQRVTAPTSGTSNDGIAAFGFGGANDGWAVGYSANIPNSLVITTTDVLNHAIPLLWHWQNGVWSVYQQP